LLFVFVFVFGCVVTIEAWGKVGLTPLGYRPSSCIYHASKINDKTPPCKVPYVKQSLPFAWFAQATASFPNTTDEVTSYNSTWNVPDNPKDKEQQVLFIYTALLNSDTSGNVEGVLTSLQWGTSEAGGGPYWGIVSWYIDSTGNTVYSDVKRTDSGSNITGSMNRHGNVSWTIVTTDSTKNSSASLTHDAKKKLKVATVTLEVVEATKCSNVPNGTLDFQHLSFSSNSILLTSNWTAQAVTECGEDVKVNNSTSITIFLNKNSTLSFDKSS